MKMKFISKHILLLCLAFVLAISLFAGCGKNDGGAKVTIKIADAQWKSLWICNAIAEFIITEGYGYPVEIIQMTKPIARAALASGTVDIHMELWQQDWLNDYNFKVAEGKIENLGTTYEGDSQFWVIPHWVHEDHNINTVEDMKLNWELFKDPEDPEKGRFINCYAGWACATINDIKMEAYGLTDYYNIMTPGSPEAEDAFLEGHQLKKEPVFGYYRAPTQIMEIYDWYVLEEPPYDADVWADIMAASIDDSIRPLRDACAYEVFPVEKGIHPTLNDSAPDIVTMLKKMNVGMWPLYHTINWSNDNNIQDYEKAAIYYLRENEYVWKTWVTAEAHDKIIAAVDAYGPVP